MNNAIMPIKANPFEHQKKAYQSALTAMENEQSRCFSLLMEMGTGKTVTSVAIVGRLYLDGKIKRALIVAPLSIVGVWQEEFKKFADFEYNLAVMSGTFEKKVDTLIGCTNAPYYLREEEMYLWKRPLTKKA